MSEERRIVTILFADMVGSTALGESLDPEDVRALLGRYYGVAQDVVAAHGGTVEKFIGDAVMAVFGLPVAHGDDAERALSAGLEISEQIRGDQRLAGRITLRFGVSTGEVIAARDRTGDFLVTGDAVNLAARLQQNADEWSVVADERTARAASRRFEFGLPLSLEVKGKSQPVTAHQVKGRRDTAAVTKQRTRLVGRDSDVQQLNLVARRAFSEKRPWLVTVMAPAGTGKTRLLEEFLEEIAGQDPRPTVATAQCLPYGQRLTYWPLRQLLFNLASIQRDASSDEVHDATHEWLKDLDDGGRTAELVATTVGAGGAENIDRSELFVAWRTAIEATAAKTPLVLVFEDLHWSSDSLLDLVEFVMQPRGGAPVLMIALSRPELLDRRPNWGGGRRNYLSLSLEPLDQDATAELVRNLLEIDAPDVVSRVVERAEGNPFYAGELVRAILDVASPGDPESVEKALVRLPDTVQAAVLARLDLLPPVERRVLQVGSVLGRDFRTAGVKALAPELADSVDAACDALADRDLVRPSGIDSVVFRHILIREVAYQTLPRAERARLHGLAARWLESVASGREEALAELVAFHYREAVTLTPSLDIPESELTELKSKAVTWLSRAADTAAAGAASVEAGRHLRGAIELASADQQPELYERLGDLAEFGDLTVDAYTRAYELARERGRPKQQLLRIVASMLMTYMRSQGSVGTRPSEEELARWRTIARELSSQVTDRRAIATFLIAESFYPFWSREALPPDELAAAKAASAEGLRLARELDDANLVSAALDGFAGISGTEDEWETVLRTSNERLAFQERLSLVERTDAHSMAAWSSAILGKLNEAEAIASSGLSQIQPGQLPAWSLHLLAWRIYALFHLGRWDEALQAGERAYQQWVDVGRLAAGYSMRGWAALCAIAWGRQNEVLSHRYSAVIEEIASQFPADDLVQQLNRDYARRDVEKMLSFLSTSPRAGHGVAAERFERVCCLCADVGKPLAPEVATAILQKSEKAQTPLLSGQLLRCIGLATSDANPLRSAHALFESCGAVVCSARVAVELGLLTHDTQGVDGGMKVLESLGDVEQLERYEARLRAARFE